MFLEDWPEYRFLINRGGRVIHDTESNEGSVATINLDSTVFFSFSIWLHDRAINVGPSIDRQVKLESVLETLLSGQFKDVPTPNELAEMACIHLAKIKDSVCDDHWFTELLLQESRRARMRLKSSSYEEVYFKMFGKLPP